MSRWPRATLLLLALGSAGTAALAAAQPFCMLQNVEVSQVANATVITLEADGLIELSSQGLQTWTTDDRGNWYRQALERITFTLRNVQGGAAPMVQVARYPVSHIEFALPPGQQQNIGLRCTLVLYKPAMVIKFEGKDDEWDYGSWRPAGPRVMIYPSQKRDKIIITIVSDRPEEPEPKREELPEVEPRLDLSGTAEALTLRAFRSDLHEVMKRIAEHTGAPIVVDDPITTRLTAHFVKMPLRRLLTSLANACGLCLCELDGAYHFSQTRPDSATAYWVGETRRISLTYIPVQQALLLLPDVVLPYVRRMDAGNSLLLSGPPPLLDRISRDLQVIDQPGYQCRLRGWVIGTQDSDQDLRQVLASFSDGNTAAGFDSAGNFGLQVGPAQAHDVLARLRALQSEGRLQMQSLPSIWCKSGYSANLFMGQRIYYWRFASLWSEEQTLDAAQAGTQLNFSTRTDGEWITAWVSVQSDLLGQPSPTGPVVMRRSASTMVRLRSGQMMLVGGLSQSDTEQRRDRPGALAWPLDAVVKGHLRVRQQSEVAVLVQVEAALMPSTAPSTDQQSHPGMAPRPDLPAPVPAG